MALNSETGLEKVQCDFINLSKVEPELSLIQNFNNGRSTEMGGKSKNPLEVVNIQYFKKSSASGETNIHYFKKSSSSGETNIHYFKKSSASGETNIHYFKKSSASGKPISITLKKVVHLGKPISVTLKKVVHSGNQYALLFNPFQNSVCRDTIFSEHNSLSDHLDLSPILFSNIYTIPN